MGIELLSPGWPALENVAAGTTTRRGGMSVGPWASLNLATHVGDDPDHVDANRRLLCEYLGAEVYWLRQVHGTAVAQPGQGCSDLLPEADAWVCFEPGKVCGVLTADCLPVFFCDRKGTRVGIAHAGWRGLARGVLETTVSSLNCPPSELLAWLGPALSAHAYQVGDEVRDAFIGTHEEDAFAFTPDNTGAWRADLQMLAANRLRRLGVFFAGGNDCTFYDDELFYSYRRDGRTGRMANLVWLHSSLAG